jgi:Mn-dependent DtxR family transcriptional regulator
MSDALPRSDDLLGILKRQEEVGGHISEAEMGRELHSDPRQVASRLRELATGGDVVRTSHGNWELTPAASQSVQPRPHPKEPR